MPRDDDSLIGLDELASILRANEGPPQAAAKRRRTGTPGVSRRLRWAVAGAAAALLVGSGLGFGLASSLTPSGGAADPQAGLGFLPERGWQVIRSKFEASPEQPSFAIASNVPLTRLDSRMARRKVWSGQPLEALQNLKPGGVVIVASFSLRGVHRPSDESFPRRALPLRLRDSARAIQPSPYSRRLGWYELRAAIGEHNVIVNVHFGSVAPARSSIIAAQRQLDRLVVGSTRPAARVAERALPLGPASSAAPRAASRSRIVDRTFACSPRSFGGVGDLDVYVTPIRIGTLYKVSTHLIVRTGGFNPADSLVLARAGPQARAAGWLAGVAGGAAGVFAHSGRCAPARASVPLAPAGLQGRPIQWYKELDCPVRGRVLVRVRSVLRSAVEWRRIDRSFEGARQPLVETQLAVSTQRTGKPIAYMEHDAKGKINLWYSAECS